MNFLLCTLSHQVTLGAGTLRDFKSCEKCRYINITFILCTNIKSRFGENGSVIYNTGCWTGRIDKSLIWSQKCFLNLNYWFFSIFSYTMITFTIYSKNVLKLSRSFQFLNWKILYPLNQRINVHSRKEIDTISPLFQPTFNLRISWTVLCKNSIARLGTSKGLLRRNNKAHCLENR